MIVTMLTVGIFVGFRFYVNSLADDGKKYYQEHNFKDLEVISYTGILPSELEEFKKVEGVVDVEGFDLLDVTADINQSNSLLPLIRLTERVSTPELLTGKLPGAKGELAISLALAIRNNIEIGDKVHIQPNSEQDNLLAVNDFTITGVVTHPDYLQVITSDFLLASDDSFDREDLNGGYLRAIMTVDYPDSLDLYSQKYYDTIHVVEERVNALFPEMIITHREELRRYAEQKLMEETAGPRQKLADYLKGLEDIKKNLDEKKASQEIGQKEYEDGLQIYEGGLQKYENDKKKLDDRIAGEREKLDEKLDSYFAVQNRRANTGFVTIYSDVKSISLAAAGFIFLFLIVCAMVVFSTVVIIVDEQRTLAGSMKSLGFFNKDIRAKYLVYGVSAALAGCILGIPAGILVEQFFRYAIGKLFVYGIPSFSFSVMPFIISTVLVMGVVILAVYISTQGMLKLTAVQLMNGFKKEKTVKKKEKKSSRGIYGRLIRRNMQTELPRVFITTVIIAISCILIGIGFNLKYAFDGIVREQVDRVWGYDIKINFNSKNNANKINKLENILKEAGTSYAKIAEIGTIYRTGDLQEYTFILVMDQETVSDFYHLRDWDTGEKMQIPDDGVLIINRLSETMDLHPGDTYTLFDQKLREHTVTVKGVYENYAGRNVIMSRQGYYDLFGLSVADNAFLVHLNGADREQLVNKLKAVDSSITTNSKEDLEIQFVDLKTTFDYVVYMLTGVAILMSVFILLNLTNIFVSRRRKELIIMRVNGFSVKQCVRFLIREAVITTLLGFVIAVIFGGITTRILVGVIEQPDAMLYRDFQPLSWAVAVAMEGIFAFITDFLSFRKVKDVKVTDINA